MKNIIVLYHGRYEGPCADGFGGAWAAWKKFGNKAEYIGVQYDFEPMNFSDKEIYMVDFCYPEALLKKLVAKNKKVVVLDHRITRKEIAPLAHDYRFELNHSGAVIAWKYFHPKKTVPMLLRYVEDTDIGKLAMPYTREMGFALRLAPFDFNAWSKMARDFEKSATRKKYYMEGIIVRRFRDKIAKELVEGGEEVVFHGYKALVVNCPGALTSEVGYLINDHKKMLAIMWYYESTHGVIKVSLRANNLTIDVASLAEKFGGGGHKQASGFSFSPKIKFPWK